MPLIRDIELRSQVTSGSLSLSGHSLSDKSGEGGGGRQIIITEIVVLR